MEDESRLEFYLGEKLILSGSSNEIAKSLPDWDIDLKRGDKLTINGEIRTVLEMKIDFPDSPNDTVTVKVKLE